MTLTQKHTVLCDILERDTNDEKSFYISSAIATKIIDFVNLLDNGVSVVHNVSNSKVVSLALDSVHVFF